MRRGLLITAILFQVLVLLIMAGKREYIAATGTTVYLRTAPIDPRDLFRGDYVRLSYEASVVPVSMASPDIAEQAKKYKYGSVVYATLATEGNFAHVTSLSTTKPTSGLFLKGRVAQSWRFGMTNAESVGVEYGIEAYFVQQGKGLEMEKQLGTRTTMQTPLEMEVAIGSDGTAVIRGHRWSPLGMGLEVIENPKPNDQKGRQSAKLRLTLKNSSQKLLALVNLPGYCSFFMEPVSPGKQTKAPERTECGRLVPANNDVVVMQPDEALYHEIELTEQPWLVVDKDGKLVQSGTLDWNERFRIVYRPPSVEATSQLKDSAIIWHGHLPSRAFHGRGNVD